MGEKGVRERPGWDRDGMTSHAMRFWGKVGGEREIKSVSLHSAM